MVVIKKVVLKMCGQDQVSLAEWQIHDNFVGKAIPQKTQGPVAFSV